MAVQSLNITIQTSPTLTDGPPLLIPNPYAATNAAVREPSYGLLFGCRDCGPLGLEPARHVFELIASLLRLERRWPLPHPPPRGLVISELIPPVVEHRTVACKNALTTHACGRRHQV